MWEEVYNRRLANLRMAIEIARDVQSSDPQVNETLERILEPVRSLQGSRAALRKADVELTPDDEESSQQSQ